MKYLIYGALVAFLAMLGFHYFTLEWQKIEKEAGLSQVGLTQPWLAAESLLALYQYPLLYKPHNELSTLVTQLDTAQLMILNERSFIQSPELERDLRRFVELGGVLVVELANSPVLTAEQPLLVGTGISLSKTPIEQNSLEAFFLRDMQANHNFADLQLQFPASSRINYCHAEVSENTDKSKPVLCEYSLGQGRLYVIASLLPFQNVLLDKAQNAQLLLKLTKGTYFGWRFDSPAVLPWWQQLLHWFPLFWGVLFLLLVSVIWMLGGRFGIVREQQQLSVPQFMLHIQASGNYLLANASNASLTTLFHESLFQHYQQHYPSFQSLDEPRKVTLLAAHSQLSITEVQQWLRAQWPDHSTDQQMYLKYYQQLRNGL